MKKGRIKKTSTVFFAIVTVTVLFVLTLISTSQHASAVVVPHKVAEHHKAHMASEDSSSIGIDRSGSTKLPKTVIGGMIVDGY